MKSNKKNKRPIDKAISELSGLWNGAVSAVKKDNIKMWQLIAAAFFIAGLVIMAVIISKLNLQTKSEASAATLKIVANKSNISIDEGFTTDVILDTQGSNVVTVKAIITYDTRYFGLISWDTSSSIFASDNSCNAGYGKPCEIIENDAANGKITIVVFKPTPGVNSSNGKIATLFFKGTNPIQPSSANFKLVYVNSGNYDDSDAIIDGQSGADILASVSGASVTVNSPSCTDFTYSEWGECKSDGTQTRIIISSSPEGCSGGDPLLIQSCNYQGVACTSFRYSKWSACQSDGMQTRTVVSGRPSGCTGGDPVLTQPCVYSPPACRSFTYSDWSVCDPVNKIQTRTVISSSPEGCDGGRPKVQQKCR